MLLLIPLLLVGLFLAAIGLALALGGPSRPAAMSSINDPFQSVDFSDLPPLSTFRASDGQMLSFRDYVPRGNTVGSVTLVHGSSASSNSMHPLAKTLVAAGYRVFALDIRGHGQSGRKGHIDYVGQLDSDLADFVRSVRPPQPSTLAGFSSGGGFVLRFAAGEHQSMFGSYLMLSPFLSQNAPNQRPASGGWTSVGIPRIIAISVLDGLGIRAFNGLAVTSFALSDRARAILTPEYDFNLATNYRPRPDYVADIRNAPKTCAIIAGTADEAFHTDQLEAIVRSVRNDWQVELVPGIGHIPLTLEPTPLQLILRHVRELQAKTPWSRALLSSRLSVQRAYPKRPE